MTSPSTYRSIVFSSAGQSAPLFAIDLNAGHQLDGAGSGRRVRAADELPDAEQHRDRQQPA